jgi:hypothetical protein
MRDVLQCIMTCCNRVMDDDDGEEEEDDDDVTRTKVDEIYLFYCTMRTTAPTYYALVYRLRLQPW